MTVTASISTKGRYFTTLPLAVEAIALQTVRPKQLVIWDDNPEIKDLREVSPYSHLFPLLMQKGIQWYHLPGGRVGQVHNHQVTLKQADTEYVWRLDDDNAPEPTCLERLLAAAQDPKVGAVGGLVHDPKNISPRPSFITGKIEDILNPFNLAWYAWSGPPEEVDHLYSTFLYRAEAGRKAGGYNKSLSPVGHREETMFSHEIKRAGYKVMVTPDALTWHFRESTGGIRSYTDGSLWDKDEKIFRAKLVEWGVTPREYKIVVLNNAIGDHIVFKKAVLPEIMRTNPGKKIILAVCFPELFEGMSDVVLASIADAIAAFGDLKQWDAYTWAASYNPRGSLADAFRGVYGLLSGRTG
jgi:GT2 family glycosyltransferase